MLLNLRALTVLLSVCVSLPLWAAEVAFPEFESQTIDAQVAIGYGVALEDVDGDGKRDILLADKKQFVWYRNPDWKRFVLAENLTERDNVCLAARDIDGDGKVEIAVGAEWNPGDTVDSGSVHYLIPPADRTQRWDAVKLPNEPVVHRMRWVRTGEGNYVLVVAPLHGRGNRGGEGAGVRLLAYVPPADVRNDSWSTELLDDTFHVTHNFDRGQWPVGDDGPEEIAYLGREGAMVLSHRNGTWHKQLLTGVAGGGEIRFGRLSDSVNFLATIEPFHGDKLVCYRYEMDEQCSPGELKQRMVLDDTLSAGHAVATGDLLGNGHDEIVVGWRSPNGNDQMGIMIHWTSDLGATWKSEWVDKNGIACEDLRLADLNDDGRPDIVAAGRSTHNLKVYWNRPAD